MHEVIDNNGVPLAISHRGVGPDVLFVHGLGSAQVLWEPIVDSLEARYRCWNLDLRGHGSSGRAPGDYQRAAYATDVAAALDHIAAPTVGVGHSLGGASLARIAAANHPHLRALYCVDAPRSASSRSASTLGIFERQLAMLREFQPENRPVEDYEDVLGSAPYVGGGTNREAMTPHQLRGRAESLSQLDPECFEAILAGTDDPNPVEPAISVPMRVIAADPQLGASVTPEAGQHLLAVTPHAEIETFDGVGHQMMMIRGYDARVLADLDDFLGRVTS